MALARTRRRVVSGCRLLEAETAARAHSASGGCERSLVMAMTVQIVERALEVHRPGQTVVVETVGEIASGC
jgi:hypothetical protein